MPISDKYKLIFIHIPKCAGVTIWVGLDLSVCRCNLISSSAPVLQHMLPKQLREQYIPEEKWNSYTKFTIIRNPYERVVSDYAWLTQYTDAFNNLSFDDFLELRENVIRNDSYHENMYYDHFYPMYFYFENITYDYIFRYENLEEDLWRIKTLFKIENNFGRNNTSEHASFVLTPAQKEKIYLMYQHDFEKFGYSK